MSELKTYKDSYLFKNKTNNKSSKALSEFIIGSTRIDKKSQAFAGVIEDIKRQQTTSIVYTVLMSDKVQLCIGNYELPRSFKVFEAYDIKTDKKSKVFIDVTGIIEFKNGYYVCRKVDILTAYLYNALVYLTYRYANTRLLNNTEIINASTKCYSSLFCFIIDYLRIIGYSENKNKIKYLAALFFLQNHLGKELDAYCKNIAAKASDITQREIGPYDLYFSEINFENIDTFINSVAKLFNLKGLDTETFIFKWCYLYGTGTQYATELFTNFAMLLTAAYTGAYIVNQRQIEKSCGKEMIAFNNAIKRIGVETFENGRYNLENFNSYTSKETVEMANAIKERNELPPRYTGKEFKSLEEVMNLADALKKYYVNTKKTEHIPDEVIKVIKSALPVMESYAGDPASEIYCEGTLLKFCKVYKNIFNSDNLRKVAQLIDDHIRICNGILENAESEESRKCAARCINELYQCKQYL